MEALTASSLHIKAASITDGVMEDYLQYMMSVDSNSGEADAMIGARPFGKGLQQWLARSPLFNMDKSTAALVVNVAGAPTLPYM